LQSRLSDIQSAGAEVVAVSVDTTEESARLVKGLSLEFPVLSDVERRAIRDWGLVHEGGKPGGGAIARPATYIVEPDGTISWRSLTENWRVRVRPEHVLDALGASR
jgi:peroxiredoxin